jgi:hypothetical protein
MAAEPKHIGIFVDLKIAGKRQPVTVVPSALGFYGKPVFDAIPSFVIDDTKIDDLKKITMLRVQDQEAPFFVFLMDNINKQKDLFYVGDTHGEEVHIPISKIDVTDIILIPVDVFRQLSYPHGSNFFFSVLPEKTPEDLPLADEFPNGLFVRNMPPRHPSFYNERKRVYFNLSRWEEFFSVHFRKIIDIKAFGIDIGDIYTRYSQAFSQGETISVEMPYYKKVRCQSTSLLCKHVQMVLFSNNSHTDPDKEENLAVGRKRRIHFVALLTGYGWIDIVSVFLS